MIRVRGTDEQERERRACERNLVGKTLHLDDRGHYWQVQVVDHLNSTALLLNVAQQLRLENVPIEDVAGVIGCGCKQHVPAGGADRA